MYNPYYQQNYQQNQTNDMAWCQGEAGAKSFPVAPGHTLPIFDSEANTFYVKSVDIMGRPLPLRIYDYMERDTTPKSDDKNYIEKDLWDSTITAFNEKLDTLLELMNKKPEPEKKSVKEKADAK